MAEKIREKGYAADVVVGIARGGVVVAKSMGDELGLPVDVVFVKKISAPHNPELAVGALAQDGISYIDEEFARVVGADAKYLKIEIRRVTRDLKAKAQAVRKIVPYRKIKGSKVIIVDDGTATGATMLAAIRWLNKQKVSAIIAALPVAPRETVEKIAKLVNECVVLEQPQDFRSVGQYYRDFQQVTDKDLLNLFIRH